VEPASFAFPLLLLPGLLTGCQRSVLTPFPAGLEPLEDCSAGLPPASSDGSLPEAAQIVGGQGDEWLYAHLCGYIHADASAVWMALQDPDVVTDRRRVTSYQETEQGVEPDYQVSFRIHNIVQDLLTVEYDIDWREGVWEEDQDGPLSVAVRFQKTAGSSLIELIEGSVLVETVQPGTVSFALVSHHRSLQYTVDDLELKSSDLYDSVVAFAHGEPLPTW